MLTTGTRTQFNNSLTTPVVGKSSADHRRVQNFIQTLPSDIERSSEVSKKFEKELELCNPYSNLSPVLLVVAPLFALNSSYQKGVKNISD